LGTIPVPPAARPLPAGSSTRAFTGIIDEVAVFKPITDLTEIYDLYKKGIGDQFNPAGHRSSTALIGAVAGSDRALLRYGVR
jgi:hypothetical protein